MDTPAPMAVRALRDALIHESRGVLEAGCSDPGMAYNDTAVYPHPILATVQDDSDLVSFTMTLDRVTALRVAQLLGEVLR